MSVIQSWAAVGVALAALSATFWPAYAAEDVLIRSNAPFHLCPEMIDNMLAGIGAHQAHVELVADTGAHYGVKLISVEANLVFLCNAVTETITVTRTTPGELVTAAR